MRFSIVLILLLQASTEVLGQISSLPPRDDGASDHSFIVFRSRLIEAIARRDADAVLAMFSSDAKLSFGAEASGPAGVQEMWFEGGAPSAAFWAELGSIVALGSVRGTTAAGEPVDSRFSAPYIFAAWPDDLDAFMHSAIVGEHVRVRAEPSLSSAVVASLSYATVPVLSWNDGEDGTTSEWTKIVLADRREGFVSSQFVRSPVGYRLGFERKSGTWSISFFVAGD